MLRMCVIAKQQWWNGRLKGARFSHGVRSCRHGLILNDRVYITSRYWMWYAFLAPAFRCGNMIKSCRQVPSPKKDKVESMLKRLYTAIRSAVFDTTEKLARLFSHLRPLIVNGLELDVTDPSSQSDIHRFRKRARGLLCQVSTSCTTIA
jgi:hypothetical protein